MERPGPRCQAPTSFGEEGSHIMSWLAATGCPGGRPFIGLSVHCHRPLQLCAIDKEQHQEV